MAMAVFEAEPADESRSVEWKVGYDDLLTLDASFAVARAVLGLANRSVEDARREFEGVGYVLVGVEPGNLAGQDLPDSSQLSAAIARYAGRPFPVWDCRAIGVADKTVLVVSVESPRPGDRIALLQKSYQPARGSMVTAGTVFVRYAGATERASREDLELLQDRLIAGTESASANQRRTEIRTLVADMVHAALSWVRSMQIIVIMTAGRDWTARSWMEIATGEMFRGSAADAQLVTKNFSHLRLLNVDSKLQVALARAEAEFADAGAFSGLHGNAPSDEDRRIAYRHLNAVESLFQDVEGAAAEVLGS